MNSQNMIVHAPHSSIEVPERFRNQFVVDDQELKEEAVNSADLWTDVLASEAWPQATMVTPPISRIVVDMERYADDSLETMAQVGRGMIYTHSCSGEPIRRAISEGERRELYETYYAPHWEGLRSLAKGQILIDLHSYPMEPWPIEPDLNASRPEIDLGHSPGLTSDSWVADLTKHFQDQGYSVGQNTPYSGVIDAGAVNAVMIEIRRDVLGAGPRSRLWNKLVGSLRSMPLPGTDR
jgi:N-formylglutamate deformylase